MAGKARNVKEGGNVIASHAPPGVGPVSLMSGATFKKAWFLVPG